jgi:hypothetical protein
MGDPTVETWYPIPSLPGLELSDRLNLRRRVTCGNNPLPAPVPVKVYQKGKGGYWIFDAKFRTHYFHHVVAEVFLGPRPKGHRGAVIRHLDDDRANNHPSNLAYGSHEDNMADARRNGRYKAVYRRRGRTLDPDKMRAARAGHAAGVPVAALAREYGICITAMCRAIRGASWADVT